MDGKDYAKRVDYLASRLNYFVRCRGCKREFSILTERVSEDDKQPKVLSATFHTLSECSNCHERHFYDYSDMMTGHEPEPSLSR